MNQFMGHVLTYLATHPAQDEFVAWSVLSALIVNMPVPGSSLTWRTMYEWLYHSLHQFANTKRPTQPVEGPEKK